MGVFDRVPLPKKIYIKVDDVDDKDIYFMAQDKLENMDNGKIGIYKLETVTSLPLEAIIHKECGTISTKGQHEDGITDYLCKKCEVTFLDNEEQTIIS